MLPPIIEDAGLSTARLGDIALLAGFNPVNWNGSALVRLSPGIEDPKGKAFYRLWFYPPDIDKNRDERKYHQVYGPDAPLYISPGLGEQFADQTIPLAYH